MVIVTRFVARSAMAVYPFIFVKTQKLKQDVVLINHEKIHHRQQLELLLLPFYLLYALNYLVNLVRYRNAEKAYMEIVFEREAYAMDTDMNYLQGRQPWAFIRFL